MIDIAYFPHVFDHIVDELYRTRTTETLLTLRPTSSTVQSMVDNKLATHLVVRGKSGVKIHTRYGHLQLPISNGRGPRAIPKVQTVDVHHFDHHAVCNFDASTGFSPCASEDAVAEYVRSARPAIVRLFDSKSFTSDACGANTVVHFTEATPFFGAGVKVRLVPAARNVINIRHGDNIGLFEVLWGEGDTCRMCDPPSPLPPPVPEVVILFTPKDETTDAPPDNPDQKRGLLNSIVVSAISYLHDNPTARLVLVGAERWSRHWFQLWPVDTPPDPDLSIQSLWSHVFASYARMGWTCPPHYAQKGKCTSLDDEEIARLQERVEFVPEDIYRDRIGEETYRLYTVE
ncbi:hypothetical protein A1Q1_06579 [Trichosporon asahii var. asahii CBS 2479]|uniref:Uncharacterized protein n=1 Tax=Trichosporon asahii var. asahii (strain ATCC 90039 / CBS 2479 / JCM 2466 / KCTC 7840 / NBRC 103889/ NCYC 2677 / UAMH 7654) TaxID=1186058 RepID=J6EQT6_TRIAS|nr:hypothetical protein A1Q1_06579 [Trichosporon asahii var. asahii CBS 2479]EJT45047.1 hypothetical protein A1Q1_06579 [Trichosporon asahii var. asahii CBS 2479]